MSAEIPARPFNTRDSVGRVTPQVTGHFRYGPTHNVIGQNFSRVRWVVYAHVGNFLP